MDELREPAGLHMGGADGGVSIPKFKDVVEVEWRHNDFTMQAEVTASYIVRTRDCIADEDSTPEKCQWLEE